MKKITTAALFLMLTGTAFAQEGRVGINTTNPKTTFDVNGKIDGSGNLLTTDITGMQAPRLTRAELTAKGDMLYGLDQKGALVFITDVSGGDATSQRINISATGYYYFDGAVWQKMASASEADITNDAWVNDATNTMVKLGTLSDGTTARPSGREFVILDTGNVGIGTTSPHSSSILDLTASDKGFLPPRMTNAQMKAIASPVNGLTVYNTTLNCLAYYVNGSFNCSHNAPARPAPVAPLGSTYTGHFNGIISGVHVGGTELLAKQTTGETFAQNTTCEAKEISAQGCAGLTQVTGASGTVYPLVAINGQCWMQTNLKEIPSNFAAYTPTSWLATSPGDQGHWGYYNTSDTTGASGWGISEPAANEGLLYQWSAAMDNSETERSRGLCPAGFHIPSDCEWMYLEHGQGMSISEQNTNNAWRANTDNNQGTPGYKLRSQGGVEQTNASGFSGLLAGSRSTNGPFANRSSFGNWWSSSATGATAASNRNLGTGSRGVGRHSFSKANGFSVRCLKD